MDSLQHNELKITQDTIKSSVDHARRRRALEFEYERRRRNFEFRRKSCQGTKHYVIVVYFYIFYFLKYVF